MEDLEEEIEVGPYVSTLEPGHDQLEDFFLLG